MTSATSLYLFVEGEDDERFFKSIIMPKLQERYNVIIPIHYAQDKKEKTDNFIKSIKSMKADYDYIYVTDIDKAQCIPSKKEEKSKKY